MQCPKCSLEISDESKFCPNCGAKFEGNNTIILGVIFCLILSVAIIMPITKGIIYKKDLYNGIISDVDSKNWESAKSKLDELGDYKNISEYSSSINYNYYISKAEEQYKNKDYKNALLNYENASNYNDKDSDLKNKITNAEREVKKLEIQERKAQELAQRKREQERKQAEARRLQAQRAEQQARNRELADLQRIVDRAFVNVSIQDFGGGMPGVYEFYVYPQAWNRLTYNDKLNTLVACRKYIELKAGVSARDAEIGTRVVNVYDNSELANYASIK